MTVGQQQKWLKCFEMNHCYLIGCKGQWIWSEELASGRGCFFLFFQTKALKLGLLSLYARRAPTRSVQGWKQTRGAAQDKEAKPHQPVCCEPCRVMLCCRAKRIQGSAGLCPAGDSRGSPLPLPQLWSGFWSQLVNSPSLKYRYLCVGS